MPAGARPSLGLSHRCRRGCIRHSGTWQHSAQPCWPHPCPLSLLSGARPVSLPHHVPMPQTRRMPRGDGTERGGSRGLGQWDALTRRALLLMVIHVETTARSPHQAVLNPPGQPPRVRPCSASGHREREPELREQSAGKGSGRCWERSGTTGECNPRDPHPTSPAAGTRWARLGHIPVPCIPRSAGRDWLCWKSAHTAVNVALRNRATGHAQGWDCRSDVGPYSHYSHQSQPKWDTLPPPRQGHITAPWV